MPPSDHDGVSDLEKAGKHRLDDARALIKAKRYRGAMYVAGYCVECLLKTKLMRMFNCRNLKELEEELIDKGRLPADATVYTHHIDELFRLTRAYNRLRQDAAMLGKFNLVNRWIPAWRYSPRPTTRKEADDFLTAVSDLVHWIEFNI